MYLTFTLIVLTILLLNSKLLNCSKRRSICDRIKLDNCTSNILVLGNPALKYPETIDETNIYCSELPGNIKCMKDYTKKCLDKFPRQAISLLTYSIGNYYKNICEAKQNYNQLSNFLRCINSVKKNLDKCFADSVETLTQISHINQSKYKFPLLCCNHWTLSNCVVEIVREESEQPRVCTKAHYTETKTFLESITNRATKNFCGHYSRGSQFCNDLVLSDFLNTTATHKLPKSILLPLIDIVLSF